MVEVQSMPEPWESLTTRILYMLLFSRDLDADVDRVAQYVCTRPLGGSLSAHREQLVAAVNAHPLRWDTHQPDPHNLGPRGEEQFRDFLLKVLQRVDELSEWPLGGDPR
jgi:hypothetical protein